MSVTLHALSVALSPITQNAGTAGNESLINRERIITPDGPRWIPVLSGNALRHQIRHHGMRWLIKEYDLKGKLSRTQANFLLHGGSLFKSTAKEDMALVAELFETWPLIHLLGGCLPGQLLHGSLNVWRATLVCDETRHDLLLRPEQRLLRAEMLVGTYQYTRGDAAKYVLDQPENLSFTHVGEQLGPASCGKAVVNVKAESESETNLMIFSGQMVQRGTLWQHGYVIKHDSQLELGALLWSLHLWQKAGGTIGSAAARGHGRLKTFLISDDEAFQKICLEAIEEYVTYARAMKNRAIRILDEAFQ